MTEQPYHLLSPVKKLRYRAENIRACSKYVKRSITKLEASVAEQPNRDLSVILHSLINHHNWLLATATSLEQLADEMDPTDWVQFAKDYVAGDIEKYIPEYLRGDPNGV